MAQKFNFSDYNASGVYFLEIDNSVITTSNVQSALRLAVGFNTKGPFNRPVYVSNSREVTSLFGAIDRKLERRGCFTNRNIRTMISKAPVYVLNLLSVDTADKDTNKDKVGFAIVPLTAGKDSSVFSGTYANMYDRTQFWIADDETFVNKNFVTASQKYKGASNVSSIEKAALMGFGNCGTKDISVIMRKAENLTGYDVTFLEYYGSEEDIPYSWINPNDYVSDYFVEVYALSGDWSSDKYPSLSTDPTYGSFFTSEGLKKDKLNKFLRLDSVVRIGSWTGCVLPNFTDKQGNVKSIDYLINKSCNETGLLFGINEKAYDHIALDGSTFFFDADGSGKYDGTTDTKAIFVPDFVGHTIDASKDSSIAYKYMSCNVKTNGKAKRYDASVDASSSCGFVVKDASVGDVIAVGDYVRAKSGLMVKILKKRVYKNGDSSTIEYNFTAADAVKFDSSKVEIHKPYSSMYDTLVAFKISGLKLCNRHLPGFDSTGSPNNEAGVKKIYSMLEDAGISKGLLNDDSIDFRYIVDTLSYGIGDSCGGKVYLSKLAKEKHHCTALINAPSMSDFAASDAPFFGPTWDSASEGRPTFDVAYIPEGGNQDMVYSADTESFTLMDFENGAANTGVYASYLKYSDGARTILVPPAADVCNAMIDKFYGGDPYASVANLNGILKNSSIIGVEYPFDETDRGYLENFGINPIIERSGNVMIYGDRTAYQTVNSDLSYMHVRELLNTIQLSCQSVLNDYVFRYNIATTRAEITTRLNPILSAMQDSGALVKYEIECDELNNTEDVINNKFGVVDIGVWISQGMEKIVVPITINRSTTA